MTMMSDVDGCIIPWPLQRAFVMSLIGSTAQASLLQGEPEPTRSHGAGHVCADASSALPANVTMYAREHDLPERVCCLHAVTHENLTQSVAACKALTGEVQWTQLQERILEERLGRCRAQFPTAQMTTADAWRASSCLMIQELKRWEIKLSMGPRALFRPLPGSPMMPSSGFCSFI